MVHFDETPQESLLHLAECAAQVAEAAAVAVEEGGGYSLHLHAAMESIPNVHDCHLDAAVLIMARMIWRGGGNVADWRDEVPKVVAAIATGCPA